MEAESMKKTIGPLSVVLCTVGAAVLAIAVAKDHISKIIDIPEPWYKAMLVIGGVLVFLGFVGFLVSVVISPAGHVLDFVNKKLGEKYMLIYASQADLPQLHSFYTEFFGDDVPSLGLMRAWVQKYRKAFAMVYRVDDTSIKKKQQVLSGSFKVLLVTEEAVRGLESGQVSGSTFEPNHIASRQKDAAAYYVGDVVAKTRLARGFILASLNAACEQAIRKGLPIYARPLTSDGLRVMTQYGFVQAADRKSSPEIGKMCKLMIGSDKPQRIKKASQKQGGKLRGKTPNKSFDRTRR
jgi:hypothetical protein